MKFLTAIWWRFLLIWFFCVTTNTGWGKETVVPLYSSAFMSTGVKLSSSLLFALHWIWQGAGNDVIVTVIRWLPFISRSTLLTHTLGRPCYRCALLNKQFVSLTVFLKLVFSYLYLKTNTYFFIVILNYMVRIRCAS